MRDFFVYSGEGGENMADAIRFEAWMRAYENDVLRLCYVILGDRAAAEDALQETFLKVWRGMERFERRGGCTEKTWITRIAVNVCRDALRSAWFRRRLLHLPLENAENQPQKPSNISQELLMDVMALPQELRQPVVLCHLQRCTVTEAAQILSVSRPTLRRRLQAAYALLRCDDEEGGVPHA